MESRSLPVPDGLAGERADAAIARLLGFSRTFAAEVVDSGGATLDGAQLAKSDRLIAGSWLEVSWTPKSEPSIVPALVPGFAVVYDDDDLVVIDKPVGVAAHPAAGTGDDRDALSPHVYSHRNVRLASPMPPRDQASSVTQSCTLTWPS